MLQVGDKLKSIKVSLQDNTETVLAQKGRKYILFFYPKDNTPTCTVEACSLRDGYKDIKKLGYELYGISIDSAKSHLKFIQKFKLNFPLISDTEMTLVETFGVWGKKKLFGREYMGILRTTFVIDEKGVITHVIEKVDSKKAAQQILNLLKKK